MSSTTGIAPAVSPESGCTWPLQARMWGVRCRPPDRFSTFRKSVIFFAARPGSCKAFVISEKLPSVLALLH